MTTLLRHLDVSRFEPHLAVLERVGERLQDVPPHVRIHELRARRARYAVFAFARLCWQLRPAVVISTVTDMNLAVLLARPLLPRRTRLLARQSADMTTSFDASRFRHFLCKHAYRRADFVICQSDYMRQEMIARLGLPAFKAIRIYNPVDWNCIEALADSEPDPFTAEGPNLLGIGRFDRDKAFDVLLRCMPLVQAAFPQACLTLVGDGHDLPLLRTLQAELGLNSCVRFLGFRRNPYPFLRHADLLVLPSRSEALPNVVLEAVALGRPVVTTNCTSALNEIASCTGLLRMAKGQSPEALAREVIDAIAQRTARQSRHPEPEFEARFGARAVTAQYEGVLWNAIQPERQPSSASVPALLEPAAPFHVAVRVAVQRLAARVARYTSAHLRSDREGLRVLAVVPGDGQGASFIFVRRQISSLVDIGLNVRTFFLRSRTSPIELVAEWMRLRREIRRFRPHLLHAHYGTVTSFLCALVGMLPLVITFRGNDLDDDPDISKLRARLGQLLSQLSALKAKRIVCVSRHLQQRLWWRHGRSCVIPTGIDLNLFRPQPKDQARALLGWHQDNRIVLFDEGRAPRRKGLSFVQSAVRAAEQSIGAIKLVILDRSIPPELIPQYLNASDCLAFASVSEGSPNIVKEALACNLPVVATDVGDVAERLKGVFPSRIARRDPTEFAKALAELLYDGRRSNGRARLAACSLSRVAESICSVYDDVVPAQALRTPAGPENPSKVEVEQ